MSKQEKNKKPHKTLLKEIQTDRKYTSLVDDYRRIVQNGKFIFIPVSDPEKDEEIFLQAVEYLLKDFKLDIEAKDVFTEMKLNVKSSAFSKINIYYFSNTPKIREIVLEAVDKEGQLYRTKIAIINKRTFIGKYLRIEYSEWFKANKTFFGLSDNFKKQLLKKRAIYRAAILTEHLANKNKVEVPEWAVKFIRKTKKKGEIAIR